MGESQNAQQRESVPAFRRAMRARLIAAREALPAAERSRGSSALERNLERLLDRLAAPVTGFCWPIRGEYDPRALMARLVAQGRKVALPVLVAERAPLDFREWTPGAAMDADRYGIPFPARGRRAHPGLIVIPVVGFDAAGFRLGYGGGYFDRSMAALDPRPIAVGTGFELGRIPSIRPRPHDIPMDWMVTEAGVFRRGPAGLSAEE